MIGELGILPLGPEKRLDKVNTKAQFDNILTTAPDMIAAEQRSQYSACCSARATRPHWYDADKAPPPT